jgi:hypothetical protein
MLLKQQIDVSNFRGLPVDDLGASQKIITINEGTVQLYYYNNGVLTLDDGQPAGTVVVAQLAYGGIKNALGSMQATHLDTSLSFASTALTVEKPFPWDKAESVDEASGETRAKTIANELNNGEYVVDYKHGIIYGKKATTANTLNSTSYKIQRNSEAVTLEASNIEIGAVELKDADTDTRAKIKAANASTSPSTVVLATQPIDEAGLVIGALPQSLVGGEKNVPNAGTAVPLGNSLNTRTIYIRAKMTNTSFVCVGDSNVNKTSNRQIVLFPGDAIVLNVANRASVYLDADVSNDGVSYLCLV